MRTHPLIDRAASRRPGVGVARRSGFRGIGGSSPAWTPAALGSKLTLWLDQRDLVEVSGAYSDWGDQSAANNDFTQGTAANRPASGQTVNGYAAPDFVDNTDTLSRATTADTLTSASASRIFFVLDNTGETPGADNAATTLEDCVISMGSGGGWIWLNWSTGGPRAVGWDGAFRSTGRMSNVVGKHIIDIKHDGVTLTARRDADAAVTVACGPLLLPGTLVRLGNSVNSVGFKGRIGSVIMCNAALTAAEETATRAYLGAKYGVTV